CGRFDAYFAPRLAPWDMAAGGLLVEVAGGTVTDLDGRPWSLDGGGILAANADLHAPLLTVLRTASAAVPVAN
ncbi:MAG: inositol monophosphatase family protein, partial [bacterium]